MRFFVETYGDTLVNDIMKLFFLSRARQVQTGNETLPMHYQHEQGQYDGQQQMGQRHSPESIQQQREQQQQQ